MGNKKKHVVLNEFYVLFRRNIVVLIFGVISLLIVLKNSELPFPMFVPSIIREFFLKPYPNTTQAIAFMLLENLSLAYIASTIFYFLVDYIPKRKKERKALLLAQKDLQSIYGSLSYIIRMFLFDVDINEEPLRILKDKIDVSKICFVKLSKKNKHARIAHYADEFSNSSSSSYNIHNDSISNVKNIEQKLYDIFNRSYTNEIEGDLLEIIDRIRSSRFLSMIKIFSEKGYIDAPGTNSLFYRLDSSFLELIEQYVKLGKYITCKYDYRFNHITEAEWQRQNEEIVLMLNRSEFLNLPIEKIRTMTNYILGIQLSEETFNKITGVLCELLIAYDYSPKSELLEIGKHIAGYLKTFEGDKELKAIAALNYLQVLVRMGTSTKKEKKEINWIFNSAENLPDYIILGALILVKNYSEAKKVMDKLSTDEKKLFISFPIYRLWPIPPVPPNLEPGDFRVIDKNKDT